MTRLSQLTALFIVCASACAMQAPGDPGARLAAAEQSLRAGKYDDAIGTLQALAAEPGASARAKRVLVRALSEVGRYDDAEKAARTFALPAALGEVLYTRGKLAAAESAFVAAGTSKSEPDSLAALADLGVLRYERGDRAGAMQIFDHFIDVYNQRHGKLSASDLTAIATACRYLGLDRPALFKDALKAFDEAISADPNDVEPRVRLADMFLDRYNSPEAANTVREILKANPRQPRALVIAARRAYFDSDTGSLGLVARALEVNPNLVEAHAYLASFRLDNEDWPGAAAEAKKALDVNPASREAMAALAASQYLSGDKAGFEQTKRTALARNPHDADFFAELGEMSARNRYYTKAVEFGREGTQVDPKNWRALAVTGMNQLRTGQPDSARKTLETAFAGDPYNVWVKNTLDLLDNFKTYTEVRTPRFQFLVDSKEAELLALYLGDLGEEAYDKLEARYGFKPVTPVRMEVYRSHADFSVRTTGLAGLGALGVSFGNILAMDSPNARKIGEFNFGSTFWHELAHAFTLGATEHRVPRWFSEGLSVYEERRARPGWGATVTPSFLQAYVTKKLLPVSKLNDGFMHPTFPEQVILSYYEASLVCEMIEQQYGAKALVDMLAGYKNGWTTEQVTQRALKSEPAAFDAKFDAYLQSRFGGDIAAMRGPFAAAMEKGQAAFNAKHDADATAAFESAKKLFPDYVSDDAPYWFLAQIDRRNGNVKGAIAELVALTTKSETNFAANLMLDSLAEQTGDNATAAAALERAIWISPYDPQTHIRLAKLSAALGDKKKVVRERRAVLALDPTDRADALYQLALAYADAGDNASAKRIVLQALENAPNFANAQDLLLKLQGKP